MERRTTRASHFRLLDQRPGTRRRGERDVVSLRPVPEMPASPHHEPPMPLAALIADIEALEARLAAASQLIRKGMSAFVEVEERLLAFKDVLLCVTNRPATDDACTGSAPLSPRELEVLRLIAAGLSNQQIADDLVISVRTAERHIHHIYAKVGVHSKAQATAYAHRGRLL